MKQALEDKVVEIAQRVGASEEIEIVDVQLLGGGNNRVLRIFIDKPEGVTHSDCENVSNQVGTILDVEDLIPGHYTLEVSSPGVERKLKTMRDFERFQGKKAKIQLREPVDDRRQWEGVLSGVTGGVIRLEASPGRFVEFPLEQVERANLKFEW
ncbi:MAG: ribosome maturation factor RimP [Candidatus Solibacter usitatus]|nr:ribosome maturation factor RimP [Candidatus Solibacter usitatus]